MVRRQNDLGKDDIKLLVRRLAIPSMLAQFVNVLYSIVDRMYIGNIPQVGEVALAGAGVCGPIVTLISSFAFLVGIGGAPLMAIRMGEDNQEGAQKILANCFVMLLALSAALTGLAIAFREPMLMFFGASEQTFPYANSYLTYYVMGTVFAILTAGLNQFITCQGFANEAMLTTIIGAVMNIILDPIFILPWGLNMGAEGAGLATFLSNCVACLYFFVLLYVKRGRTYVCVNPKMFSFKRHIVVGVCAVGIPASIQNLLNVTGMSVLNNFTSAFGSNAVAAMGIAQKINSVTVQIALGLSQGIMPLISYNYASGNIKRMKKTFFFTARIALVFLVLMEIAYYAGARTWVGLFMQDQQIVDYGARFLRGFCLGMPFLAIDFLAVGVFAVLLLFSYARLMTISQQVVALNSEMTTLQSEEAKLRAQYELAYDLDAIQESLTTSGTMVEPQNGQTVYVDLSEPNTVKVFQQEEGTSGLEGMFQSVKSIAEEIVTYFR